MTVKQENSEVSLPIEPKRRGPAARRCRERAAASCRGCVHNQRGPNCGSCAAFFLQTEPGVFLQTEPGVGAHGTING